MPRGLVSSPHRTGCRAPPHGKHPRTARLERSIKPAPLWLLQAIVRRWHPAQDSDEWANHHPWAEVLPGYSVAIAFAWLVILASDMRSPLTIRLAVGVVVVSSASLFWLYRGSIASRKARIAFHYALLAEQQTQECLTLTQLGTASRPGGESSGSNLDDEHEHEETSLD